MLLKLIDGRLLETLEYSLIFFSIPKVSSFVISLLFRVCEETNRIGGHVIGR